MPDLDKISSLKIVSFYTYPMSAANRPIKLNNDVSISILDLHIGLPIGVHPRDQSNRQRHLTLCNQVGLAARINEFNQQAYLSKSCPMGIEQQIRKFYPLDMIHGCSKCIDAYENYLKPTKKAIEILSTNKKYNSTYFNGYLG